MTLIECGINCVCLGSPADFARKSCDMALVEKDTRPQELGK